jgi:sugar phosphate isomerase/epimerase
VPQLAPSNRITAGQLDHKTPGTLDKRLAARAEHMEGLREMKADGRVVDGGAMLDKDGKMVGSVMLLNFPDRAAHVIGLYNTAYRMQWTVGRFCGCVMCEPTESGRFWGRRWLMNETQAINGGRPGAGDWRDGSVDDTLTIVDAHHHLWDLTALHYPWLDDAIVEDFMLGDYSRLRRNYCPGDYRGDASKWRIVATVHALATKEAVGQVLSAKSGGVTEQQGWDALTHFVEQVIPTAEKAGVKLAAHPHDPAYPPGGLNGVEHVVGSIEGICQFLDLAPESVAHGLNFCQGTVAEMSEDPSDYVVKAIREFGGRKRICMVHFRNIKGGYLDFSECFADEGSVDMAASIRAYREVGYDGIPFPDHVPVSDLDPARERFFGFALGYTRGLLQAIPA